MTFATCTIALALALNSATGPVTSPAAATPAVKAAAPAPVPLARWQMDLPEKRPAALPVMYTAFGALQAADIVSTRRALRSGADEANPLMRNAAKNGAVMLAVKALSTAGTIYFTERAWKKNRKGAIILMAAINGVTAAITARNFRNARNR